LGFKYRKTLCDRQKVSLPDHPRKFSVRLPDFWSLGFDESLSKLMKMDALKPAILRKSVQWKDDAFDVRTCLFLVFILYYCRNLLLSKFNHPYEFVELYFRLGIQHILDLKGIDHILFVLALCAVFIPRDWKKILILVTAFTIGHSITWLWPPSRSSKSIMIGLNF